MRRYGINLLALIGCIGVAIFGYYFGYRYPLTSMRAFRITADSMCPAVCQNEHMFAQMDPASGYVPKRNDVILFHYQGMPTNWVKRVIGVPGDVISSGTDNTILVNGTAWRAPAECGGPSHPKKLDGAGDEAQPFEAIKVPGGSFFVIGDNLAHSFDSRIKGFGLVPQSQITGKALMVYYSPRLSRIGCRIR